MQGVAPSGLSGYKLKQYIMRTTGPQQFFTQTFSTLSTFNIPKNIPLLLPLAHIIIQFHGRITVGTSFTAGVSPEAPQTLLQQVQIKGTHSTLGFLTPVQMSGASLFAMNRLFGNRGNAFFSTTASGVQTLQPELTSPMGIGTAFYSTTGGDGSGHYDTDIFWVIPTYPYGVADADALLYLWNAQAWGQTLQMQLTTGDQTSIGTTGAATFTAYGSNSGSPVINILLDYVQMSALQNSVWQAVSVKNVYTINSVLQSNANNVRLQLLQNQRTANVVLKTGTLLGSTSAGVSVFGSLSDAICEQTQIYANNNPIRNLQVNMCSKEFYAQRFNGGLIQGYLPISFVDSWPAINPHLAYKGEKLPGGAQLEVRSNVVGAAGTNQGEVIQDMIYGAPVVAGGATP